MGQGRLSILWTIQIECEVCREEIPLERESFHCPETNRFPLCGKCHLKCLNPKDVSKDEIILHKHNSFQRRRVTSTILGIHGFGKLSNFQHFCYLIHGKSTGSLFEANLMHSISTNNEISKGPLSIRRIFEYVNNTQEKNHKFGIKIKNIFRVEPKTNSGFPLGTSPIILWHGTAINNLSSILSTGFQLPCGPAGKLQGKGIYFADRVSKSGQYCDTKRIPGSEGVLLLCSVNLGNTFLADQPDNKRTKPPNGYDSVTCYGENIPDPLQCFETKRKSFVPIGTSVPNKTLSGYAYKLAFNEYVVYSHERILIEYLVFFEFTTGKFINVQIE